MCDPVSGTMAVLSATGSMIDSKNQNKAWAAQEEARRKQKMEMVRQANSQDAQVRLQMMNSYKNARAELEQASIKNLELKGAVETAIGESNLEGRSMDRVRADVERNYLNTKTAIQSSYEDEYANQWAERENIRDNLIGALEGSTAAQKPSALGQVLNTAQAGVNGYITGQNLKKIMYNDANLSDGRGK